MEGMTRYVLLPTELSYWAALPWHKAGVLPSDFPDKFPTDDIIVEAIRTKKILDTYRVYEEVLDAALTLELYNRCGGDFENYLIAVFFLAVAGEKQLNWLDLNVANSGRNMLPADYGVNTYKLVGYIATARALLLQRPDSGHLLTDIEQLTEQMKGIPNGGLGFFLLREFIPDEELKNSWYSRRQQGEIFFNYTGRVNTTFMNEQYETIEEDTGRNIHIEEFQNTLLSCFVTIQQHRLIIRFGYSAVYLKERTIQNMAQAMVAMFRQIVSKQLN
jgi:non-ribosomal peptide synthase protein (TIGR01720 family)